MEKKVSKRSLYSILMISVIIGFWVFENFYTPDTYSPKENDSASLGLPDYILPKSNGERIVHGHYTLSYLEEYEQAEWVAYELQKHHLTYDDRKRPYFIEDPKVKTKSADWRNYKGSGYDRGHLCPAGDRRFSEQAYNETFYTSNVSPQNRDFNAGIWNRLEMKVRQWAKRYDKIYVITAGVLEPNLEEIGEEDVDVPQEYYKIVVRGEPNALRAIGFLMEGKENTNALQKFAVPIDKIEQRTGIDFFSTLSDEIQESLENSANVSQWAF